MLFMLQKKYNMIIGNFNLNNNKVFIIAELSANHNGDINDAYKIIDMAKSSGADCVKLQTYTPDTMTIDCQNPDFLIDEGLWKGRNLYDLYKQAYTPFEWHPELFSFSQDIGIICFSSPFSEEMVDKLSLIHI